MGVVGQLKRKRCENYLRSRVKNWRALIA